ncbi:hypothetical protein AVEN_4131-1 [Araneus ventricosus]|uniref:Uncharacterized protein n=1 Tax=Araneus ventricosus TaxID=182803 RepID=A0A4Y2LBW9_ARAVE|nr:hypothetical protein AVEN_4131-1 [Araneus ventricosus]
MERLNNNVLPLKDIAVRRMVAVLFKESDILASVRNFHCKSIIFLGYENLKVWQEAVEDKLSDKISKIGLPAPLTKLLIDTSKPMGRQIPGWKTFHEEYLFDSLEEGIPFDVPILESLCWTAAGELDYRKTAEELIRSDFMDIVKRYQLASLYCLEDYIRLFWEELPEEKKMYFYDQKRHFQIGKQPLQFWWPYIIRGEQSRQEFLTRFYRIQGITFHQYAFQYSAVRRNKAAAVYFFQKLTQEEKEASLMSTTEDLVDWRSFTHSAFPKEKVSEMLCYLLSVMTPDQQMQLFEKWPYRVLGCFLRWPLQDHFSEIADIILNFFPASYYNTFLKDMYECFKNSGYYFQKLFPEFFLRIPFEFRKSFVDRQREPFSYFAHILMLEDKEALATTLRCVDDATRAGIVFSDFALDYFRSSIPRGRWDVVAVFLREARLSKDDRERLKEMNIQTRRWTRFFQFLDETDAPNMRCSGDETPTAAKMKKT